MSSAKFDKMLVLLGPNLTFQDSRMRKIRAARRKDSSDIELEENYCLIFDTHFIHYSFIWKK